MFFLENVGNLPFRSADLIENDGSNGGSNRRKRMWSARHGSFIGESSPQKQGLMEKYEKRLRTSGVGMKDSNLHSWDDWLKLRLGGILTGNYRSIPMKKIHWMMGAAQLRGRG
jgi:hypothetical protein